MSFPESESYLNTIFQSICNMSTEELWLSPVGAVAGGGRGGNLRQGLSTCIPRLASGSSYLILVS